MSCRGTEGLHPLSRGLQSEPPQVVLGHLLDAQIAAALTVRAALPALEHAARTVAAALVSGHRVAYAGAGSSGLMALADALELPGTFGVRPEACPVLFAGGQAALLHMVGAVEDDPALAAADLDRTGLGAGDVVICVSASGRTPYALAIAEGARGRGVTVIGIASVECSVLLQQADVAVLLDTGPELVAGSTRMGAGTAQKIALNLISTLTGVQLGHVHDGFMVNLTADNSKLRARATGIVAAIAGVNAAEAETALAATHGAVKPAVLVAAGATGAAAARLLTDSGGHLGPALARLGAD